MQTGLKVTREVIYSCFSMCVTYADFCEYDFETHVAAILFDDTFFMWAILKVMDNVALKYFPCFYFHL